MGQLLPKLAPQAGVQFEVGPLHLDPGHRTIAVVDAFADANIESDLAVYRSHYGFSPCTTASGCLTILNQSGTTSPLPTPWLPAR